MEPPQIPLSGRFRLRVKIFPPEASGDDSVPAKRSLLIAKGPSLPLADLTIRELCAEIVKRYTQIYPSELVFNVQRSQDEGGSDLYLDDLVGDIFEDNEVFRIIQGASIRESLPPDPKAFSSFVNSVSAAHRVGVISDNSQSRKRRPSESQLEESRFHEKRQRVGYRQAEQPIVSCERDEPATEGAMLQFNAQDDVVPETQMSAEDSENIVTRDRGHEAQELADLQGQRSPLLGENRLAENDRLGDQEREQEHEDQQRRLPSPISTVGSGFRDRIFSNEPEERQGRLKIRPTLKKRLLSHERSHSASTSATTPILEENSAPEAEKPVNSKDSTPKPINKLKRPSIFMSGRSRGTSASRVYDEIDETDNDEPHSQSKTGKEFCSPTFESPRISNGVQVQKWSPGQKTASERRQISSRSSETGSAKSVNGLSATGSPLSNDISTKARNVSGNDTPEAIKGLRAKQTAVLKAKQAALAEQKKKAELSLVESRRREQASAKANKEAEARARKNEAEVARLPLPGSQQEAVSVPAKPQVVAQGTYQRELEMLPAAVITSHPPKVTPIPVPVSSFRRSSTPFIPRGRPAPTTRPLKPAAPAAPGSSDSSMDVLRSPGKDQPVTPAILTSLQKIQSVNLESFDSSTPKAPTPILPPVKKWTSVRLIGTQVPDLSANGAMTSSESSRIDNVNRTTISNPFLGAKAVPRGHLQDEHTPEAVKELESTAKPETSQRSSHAQDGKLSEDDDTSDDESDIHSEIADPIMTLSAQPSTPEMLAAQLSSSPVRPSARLQTTVSSLMTPILPPSCGPSLRRLVEESRKEKESRNNTTRTVQTSIVQNLSAQTADMDGEQLGSSSETDYSSSDSSDAEEYEGHETINVDMNRVTSNSAQREASATTGDVPLSEDSSSFRADASQKTGSSPTLHRKAASESTKKRRKGTDWTLVRSHTATSSRSRGY